TPETRSVRRGLLDTALSGLDEIARSAEATPPDLSRAVAHQKLGEIYRQVGRSKEAAAQLDRARGLAKALSVAAPRDRAARACLLRSYPGLGELGLLANDPAGAVEHFRRGVGQAESITAIDPSYPGARRGLLEAYIRLGRSLGFQKELGEA